MDVILVSHGDRRSVSGHKRLSLLEAELKQRLAAVRMQTAAISDEGALERCLVQVDSPLIVTSLLFSRGFFYDRRIAAPVRAVFPEARILSPLVESDDLAGLIASACKTKRLVLIGHGAKRSSASRLATADLAERISNRHGLQPSIGFLEEEPFASNVIDQVAGPFDLVGLFLEGGLHGGEDFRKLEDQAGAQAITSRIVGDAPDLADLLEKALTQEIEAIRR